LTVSAWKAQKFKRAYAAMKKLEIAGAMAFKSAF
jgi:hypothetical protein